MEELAALGERETLLSFALKEKVPAVIDVAADALFPEPAELLVHILTVVKGSDAALASRLHLPSGNYLYAESAIVDLYRRRGSRLAIDSVEGLGLAYMRGMAPSLQRMTRTALVNLEEARSFQGAGATMGVLRFADQEERHTWSGRSAKGIAAAVALRRMDCDLDTSIVREKLSQLHGAMDDCPQRRKTRAQLEWVLRDAEHEGFDELLDALPSEASGILPDVATSLLKRGQEARVDSLVGEHGDVYFWAYGFCYWPLLNYLEDAGLTDLSSVGLVESYRRARELSLLPPPWWQWR